MKLFTTLFIVVLAALVGFFLQSNGVFRSIQPHGDQDCSLIRGPMGAEDLQVHDGVAYISSDDRRKWFGRGLIFDEHEGLRKLPEELQKGAIYVLDLATKSPVPRKLPIKDAPEGMFHPHGLSLTEVDGQVLLAVICHSLGVDELRVFRVAFVEQEGGAKVPVELQWLRTLRHPLISQNINDVHMRMIGGELTYYVSVLGAAKQGTFSAAFEMLTQRPWSFVAKCVEKDKFTCTQFATGLSLANGVNTSPDGLLVYVGVTQSGKIHVYSLEGVLLKTVDLASGIDNIDVDPNNGDLYVGCHPKLLDFIRHRDSAEVSSPTQVLRVRRCEPSEPSRHQSHDSSSIYGLCQESHMMVEEIYLSLGHASPNSLSAAAVGAFDPKTRSLVIGAVFDDGVVVCPNR